MYPPDCPNSFDGTHSLVRHDFYSRRGAATLKRVFVQCSFCEEKADLSVTVVDIDPDYEKVPTDGASLAPVARKTG